MTEALPLGQSLSIILPTYNEAENIGLLIEAIYDAIPNLFEVIVVDDNSPDGTARVVEQIKSRYPERRILLESRLTDRGLTKSLWHGITHARGELVGWMDCDFSMPPEVLPQLLRAVHQGYDIAVGSRFVRGGSFKRNTTGTSDSALAVVLSRMMNYFIQLLLDHTFKDYTSGFAIVRRQTFDDIHLQGNYGEYFIDYIYRAIRSGFRVIEIPYVCLPRLRGESKTGRNLFEYLIAGSRYVITAMNLRLSARLFSERKRRIRLPALTPRFTNDQPAIIRPATFDLVPLIAGLHRQVLSNTLNSRLGLPFLEDLYGCLLKDLNAGLWATMQDSRVIGFVSITTDLEATQRQLRRGLRWNNWATFALQLVFSQQDRSDLWAHQRLARRAKQLANPYPTVLTLGVTPDAEGYGVARCLLEQAIEGVGTRGGKNVFVDTQVHNDRAKVFYEHAGFREIGRVSGNILFQRNLGQ